MHGTIADHIYSNPNGRPYRTRIRTGITVTRTTRNVKTTPIMTEQYL